MGQGPALQGKPSGLSGQAAGGCVFRTPGRVVALVAAMFFAVGGCADGGRPAPAVRPSPSGSSSPSTPSGLFVTGERCPLAEETILGPDAGCVTTAVADLDADPARESFVIYGLLDDRRLPKSWRAAVIDDDQVAASKDIRAGSDISYPRTLGAADVDRDGRDEVFVIVLEHFLHGAVTQDIALFSATPERIGRIGLPGGAPFIVSSMRLSELGQGARCEDAVGDSRGELVTMRASSANRRHTLWQWSERVYSLRDSNAVQVGARSGRMRVSGYNDPVLDAFFEIRCGDVRLP